MLNRVVIIDDEPINCFIVEQLCKKLDFSVNYDSFTDAESALSFLENATIDDFPALIFLDLNMPVFSGWELIDILKPKLVLANCKIVILTSSMLDDDKKKADNEAIIHSFLIKPIDKEVVARLKESIDS